MARARLAYVSLGQPAIAGPRRAIEDEPSWHPMTEPEPESFDPDSVDDVDLIPLEDTPERATGWRAKISRTHLIALAVVLLTVVAAVGYAWSRSSAEELPAVPASAATITSEAPPAQPEASPSPTPETLRVHVLGGVMSPGVVSLPEGSIVADAIDAAGGLTPEASPGDLNLAQPLASGMQIRVGTPEEGSEVQGSAPADGPGGGAEAGPLDLNAATAAQLEELPGVGPVTAAAIIAWRDEHGPFRATSELQEISGIGEKTFQKLEPMVRV